MRYPTHEWHHVGWPWLHVPSWLGLHWNHVKLRLNKSRLHLLPSWIHSVVGWYPVLSISWWLDTNMNICREQWRAYRIRINRRLMENLKTGIRYSIKLLSCFPLIKSLEDLTERYHHRHANVHRLLNSLVETVCVVKMHVHMSTDKTISYLIF